MGDVSNEVRRFETLIEINALINSQYRDVTVLLSRIMESAERLIGSDASSLLLVDTGTNQLYFEIALGAKGDDVKKYTLEMGEGIAGWVAQNGRSLVVNDTENDPRHFSLIGEDIGYKTRNLIAVPLRAKDEVIGVLEVINKSDKNSFDDEDLRFLEVLADQASIAIQNAREYHQITRELDTLKSSTDVGLSSTSNEIIWKSPVTGSVLDQADKIALAESPVLILGESGTGKELLAERLHSASHRNGRPLVKVMLLITIPAHPNHRGILIDPRISYLVLLASLILSTVGLGSRYQRQYRSSLQSRAQLHHKNGKKSLL